MNRPLTVPFNVANRHPFPVDLDPHGAWPEGLIYGVMVLWATPAPGALRTRREPVPHRWIDIEDLTNRFSTLTINDDELDIDIDDVLPPAGPITINDPPNIADEGGPMDVHIDQDVEPSLTLSQFGAPMELYSNQDVEPSLGSPSDLDLGQYGRYYNDCDRVYDEESMQIEEAGHGDLFSISTASMDSALTLVGESPSVDQWMQAIDDSDTSPLLGPTHDTKNFPDFDASEIVPQPDYFKDRRTNWADERLRGYGQRMRVGGRPIGVTRTRTGFKSHRFSPLKLRVKKKRRRLSRSPVLPNSKDAPTTKVPCSPTPDYSPCRVLPSVLDTPLHLPLRYLSMPTRFSPKIDPTPSPRRSMGNFPFRTPKPLSVFPNAQIEKQPISSGTTPPQKEDNPKIVRSQDDGPVLPGAYPIDEIDDTGYSIPDRKQSYSFLRGFAKLVFGW